MTKLQDTPTTPSRADATEALFQEYLREIEAMRDEDEALTAELGSNPPTIRLDDEEADRRTAERILAGLRRVAAGLGLDVPAGPVPADEVERLADETEMISIHLMWLGRMPLPPTADDVQEGRSLGLTLRPTDEGVWLSIDRADALPELRRGILITGSQ